MSIVSPLTLTVPYNGAHAAETAMDIENVVKCFP